MSKKHNEEIADDGQSETEQSRRDFLKKAGKFAVYTPPAVMLLMKPSYATLSKSYCGRPQGGGGHSYGGRGGDHRARFEQFRERYGRGRHSR